jgi:L-amino acid N-acyltransferase YncA
VHVRRARRDDVPAIRDIYNEAVLTTTATYDYEPQTVEQQLAWFDQHVVFVAETPPGQVVGWSSIGEYRSRPGYQFTVEDSIYVADGYRGQGVGKLLLAPAIDAARQLGKRAVVAVIDADSEASHRLHRRFGFKEMGRLRQIGFKFGRWLDVIYMELLLA